MCSNLAGDVVARDRDPIERLPGSVVATVCRLTAVATNALLVARFFTKERVVILSSSSLVAAAFLFGFGSRRLLLDAHGFPFLWMLLTGRFGTTGRKTIHIRRQRLLFLLPCTMMSIIAVLHGRSRSWNFRDPRRRVLARSSQILRAVDTVIFQEGCYC